jgi:7-cyano-7-deazaguanine reductase
MPRPELLETFANPHQGRDYEIHMTCPEFTSLCPLGGVESDAEELRALQGGAPDFGTIEITYVPAEQCLELKSLKLYLWSYRNQGAFHEAVTNKIADDIIKAVAPRSLELIGDWYVRGGIGTVVTVRHEKKASAKSKRR